MERWLHRHVFKVGWLVTKNFQTTTILYYTFFLPGVFLHEFVYWLAAGVLNIRADRQIGWPEKQEIGELKLNFVKLSKKTSAIQMSIISLVPLVVALLVIWLIATQVFDIEAAFATMQSGTIDDVAAGFNQLTSTTDFWLWIYFVFTVGNTMMPGSGVLRGWRPIIVVIGAVIAVLIAAGLADDVGNTLIDPLMAGLNGLSLLFAMIIIADILGVAALALIENTIERVTGDSATFKNGKMIAMRREEVLALRASEREKARKAAQRRERKPQLPAGPPSIYNVPLPIPGAPGDVAVTQTPALIVEPDQETDERDDDSIPQREQPDVITSTAARRDPIFNPSRSTRPDDDDDNEASVAIDPPTIPPPDESDEPAAEAEEKPLRIGEPLPDQAQAEDKADDYEPVRPPAHPRSYTPGISRPTPARPPSGSDDAEDDDEGERPAYPASTSTSVARPRSYTPGTSRPMPPDSDAEDDGEEDESSARPAARRPSMFGTRPTTPTSSSASGSGAKSMLSSRLEGLRKQEADDNDDDDEEDEDITYEDIYDDLRYVDDVGDDVPDDDLP